jgi:hypothetical protein
MSILVVVLGVALGFILGMVVERLRQANRRSIEEEKRAVEDHLAAIAEDRVARDSQAKDSLLAVKRLYEVTAKRPKPMVASA